MTNDEIYDKWVKFMEFIQDRLNEINKEKEDCLDPETYLELKANEEEINKILTKGYELIED